MSNFANALMVEAILVKGQGIFWIFLHLLALGNGSRESFDAGQVRYPPFPPVTVCLVIPSDAVDADIQNRQRPNGGMDGAGVSEMYIQMAWRLTGTWGGRRPQ